MSNVVQFLESVGCHPAIAFRRSDLYVQAVASLDIDEHQRAALLNRDDAAIGTLLDVRSRMICAICTPDDEQEAVPDEGDVDGDSIPDDEPGPAQD